MHRDRDQKLNILVRRLYENLAGDLERIALFGSRARDDWRPDSDYDLLIVVRESTPSIKDRVYSVVTDFELEYDYDLVVSAHVVSSEHFSRFHPSPFSFWTGYRNDEKVLWTRALS